jgi:two-component sensor histidine kinase
MQRARVPVIFDSVKQLQTHDAPSMETVMTHTLQPLRGHSEASTLLVGELLHRIRNDYARIISFVSIVSSRSRDPDAQIALRAIKDHLHNAAETHRLLSPPLCEGTGEFTEAVTSLCGAITASFEMEGRPIALLLTFDRLVYLDVERSWRACLILYELVNNARRHAFSDQGGCISIAVTTTQGQIVCRVTDDGCLASPFERGVGTRLVDGLVAALDGFVERQFTGAGTIVTISFPTDPASLGRQPSAGADELKAHGPSAGLMR